MFSVYRPNSKIPPMKLVICLLLFVGAAYAQQPHINSQNGLGVSGYDVVAYFNNNAIKGKPKFKTTYKDVTYQFSSQQNLEMFRKTPEQFLPQYGGFCAYAIATDAEKMKVNPKTFEVREGKLYLFYDAFFNNTFESWLEEGPEKLIKQADINWKQLNE